MFISGNFDFCFQKWQFLSFQMLVQRQILTVQNIISIMETVKASKLLSWQVCFLKKCYNIVCLLKVSPTPSPTAQEIYNATVCEPMDFDYSNCTANSTCGMISSKRLKFLFFLIRLFRNWYWLCWWTIGFILKRGKWKRLSCKMWKRYILWFLYIWESWIWSNKKLFLFGMDIIYHCSTC